MFMGKSRERETSEKTIEKPSSLGVSQTRAMLATTPLKGIVAFVKQKHNNEDIPLIEVWVAIPCMEVAIAASICVAESCRALHFWPTFVTKRAQEYEHPGTTHAVLQFPLWKWWQDRLVLLSGSGDCIFIRTRPFKYFYGENARKTFWGQEDNLSHDVFVPAPKRISQKVLASWRVPWCGLRHQYFLLGEKHR